MKKLKTSSTKYLPIEKHFERLEKLESIDLNNDENIQSDDAVEDFVKLLEQIKKADYEREIDPNWTTNNLEYDLRSTDWILGKVKNSESYSQNLYAALCNNLFQKKDTWPILTNQTWGCSWRRAGAIIADMREQGNYIDWYCSGIAGGDEPYVYNEEPDLKRKGYVPEGQVTDEILEDLNNLGWLVLNTDNKGKKI